ncbi:MAG TPA: phospholipid carrier-dependent glycosyltransferase [Nitriliruptorales bacterium]|nr:phospholipid carrier-dependent glycosyltransferase [Nitriliruptorales bacterium]
MNRQRVVAFLIPALLVVVAAVVRVVLLSHPETIVFDETYYVNDARAYLDQGVEEGFGVHPPVGKWLIAAGIAIAGDESFGWRISGVVAGVAVALLTYLMGARLLRWRGAAALAGLLATVDGLLFVQSRTSMLDIFLAAFVALGAWLLLVDHDRSRLAASPDELAPRWTATATGAQQLRFPIPAGGSDEDPTRTGPGPWTGTGRLPAMATAERDVHARADGAGAAATATLGHGERRPLPRRGHALRVLAGAAFGLAVATKWSGALALVAAVLLVVGWELAWRRRCTGRALTQVGRLVGSTTLAFVLVPAAVYLLSYVPWLVNYARTTEGERVCTADDGSLTEPCHVSLPGRFAGLWRYQRSILTFHNDLEADHPYRAPAYTWPVMGRPVVYYWKNCDENRARGIATRNEQGQLEDPEPCVVAQGNAAEIIALGNPALWWVALASLVPLGIGAALRDRRAWFILAFWGVQAGPWMILSLPGLPFSRPLFFFYMTPVVVFLALAATYSLVWLDEVIERHAARRGVQLSRRALTPGAVLGAVIGLAAVGLFLYFYPVHVGMELPEAAVRQRWWFRAWI